MKIVFIGLIFSYIFFYPPFRGSSIPVFIPFRLTIETLILIYLLTRTQGVSFGKIQVNLLLAVFFVFLFGVFSFEHTRHLLSFFNKLLFFILLIKVLQDDYKLMVSIRKVWIIIWYLLSFSAIIGIIGFSTGLLPFYSYEYYNPTKTIIMYSYDFNPLIGGIKPRSVGPFLLQQYVGWTFEAGQLAYYFGINFILSGLIYNKQVRYNWFKLINFISGLLTFSLSFYLFFFIYFIIEVLKKIQMKWLFYFIIPFIIYYFIYFYINPENLLYTSMLDRVWRVDSAMNILSKMNIMELLFGLGSSQVHELMGGGGITVSVLSLILGRGLLLTIFYLSLIIKYSKYNYTLLSFIIYYSFIFGDMIFYPITLLIIVIGYQSFNYEYIKNYES